MKRRLLAVLLSACMLATVPYPALAADTSAAKTTAADATEETAAEEEPAKPESVTEESVTEELPGSTSAADTESKTDEIASDEVSEDDGWAAYTPKNAQAERDETEEAAEAAKKELEKIWDQYRDRPGLLGFISWMQEQDGLTDDQKDDLETAGLFLCMMSQVSYETFSDTFSMPVFEYSYTAPSGRTNLVEFDDENDAITVPNIKKSIQIMKDINAKKTTDNNYPGLKADVTDFTSFAIAAVNVNKGAAFTNHVYTFGYNECLAFGYPNPVDGWYDEEKASYDAARDALGLTAGSLKSADNDAITQKCYEEDEDVGHYTNIIGFYKTSTSYYDSETDTTTTVETTKPTPKVAGAGYTGEGEYGNTSSYDTYEYNEYVDEGITGTYTISEFETLFNRYLSEIQYNKFKDVTHFTNSYYDAVYWAARNGITTGYSDGTFGVSKNCSRGAFVTFLWRQQGSPEPTLTAEESGLKDFGSIGKSYQKAVLWAVEKGITTGYGDHTFRAGANVTRGAAVTFLWRAAGKPEVSITRKNVTFTDMVPAGSSFEKGILWAVEKGITTGYKNKTFRPSSYCTRGATVTFLKRFDALQ